MENIGPEILKAPDDVSKKEKNAMKGKRHEMPLPPTPTTVLSFGPLI